MKNTTKQKPRLYIFDMDGTLLPNTTASLEISKITGHTEELETLEAHYKDKKIDSCQFATTIHQMWGALPYHIILKAFHKCPKIQNIPEVLAHISKEGNISCLMTSSPHFFANLFYDYGFNYVFSSQMLNLAKGSLHIEKILKPEDKPLFAEHLCSKLALDYKASIAFGDSMTDVPLFQSLHHTISVNGDERVRPYAKHHYEGMDLMHAYEVANTSTF
jgi:phosphoserine phosphatase